MAGDGGFHVRPVESNEPGVDLDRRKLSPVEKLVDGSWADAETAGKFGFVDQPLDGANGVTEQSFNEGRRLRVCRVAVGVMLGLFIFAHSDAYNMQTVIPRKETTFGGASFAALTRNLLPRKLAFASVSQYDEKLAIARHN